MKAYYFRFVDGKKPTGHVGLVCGQDMADIFYEIDRYGNPYDTQLRPITLGSFCILAKDSTAFEASEEFYSRGEKWFNFPRDFSPY